MEAAQLEQLLKAVLLFATGVFGGLRVLLFIRDYRRKWYGYSLLHLTMAYVMGILVYAVYRAPGIPVNFIDVSFTIAVILGIVAVGLIFIRDEPR